MVAYDQSFGALLIGTWVNCMLFMLEITQAYTFYSVFHRDPIGIKWLVGFNLFVDALGTANTCACVYLYVITNWGDTTYSLVQNWAVPTYVILSGTSACTVQLFLTYRFWNLSKIKWITLILSLFSLAAYAGAIANAITVIQHSTFADRDFNIKTVIIWLVASAVADIAIALSLVVKFQMTSTSFQETKNLIQRLTFTAIQTGSVSSALAILCLILYLVNTSSNVTVGFGFCIGRVYTLTMLFNLNTRAKGRSANVSSSEPHSTGHRDNGETAFNLRNLATTGDVGMGISVHRIVRIDGDHSEYYDPKQSNAEAEDQKNQMAV